MIKSTVIIKFYELKGETIMQVPVGSYTNATNINVTYTTQAAHITNDAALKTALRNHGAMAVANAVKNYYSRTRYENLDVDTTSMAVEIHGHVVPGAAASAIKNSPIVPQLIKNQCDSILRSTNVIDSGSMAQDDNRAFWNTIATIMGSTILSISI